MRYLFPTLFLAIATTATAQTIIDNHIELSVSDTIGTVIERITYDFEPEDVGAEFDVDLDWEVARTRAAERAKKMRTELEKGAAKQGFKVVPVVNERDKWAISSYYGDDENRVCRFEVKSEAELDRLVAWLRNQGKGVGYPSNFFRKSISSGEDELVERLYAKAAKQAGRLATLGGRKLGELVAVMDPETREMTMRDLIAISARDRSGADENAVNVRTLVFRFRLLDK